MKKPIFLISVLTMMLTGFSQAMARQFEAPAMGWSSWNAYMVDISDSIISNQARMLKESGLSDCGYKYVNIDDGFFGKRDAQGYMTPHPERFPWGVDGMANLVKYIHSLGLKAGIYSDAGTNTCGSSYNHDINGKGAGMYGHDVVDATRYFIDWDFDFIKIDYCGGQELKLDEQARYTAIRNVIDSIAHKKVHLNVCRWSYPGTWISGIANSWRISGDIRPVWHSIKYCIDKNLYLSAYAGDGHYNDMDMLAVGYNHKPSAFWDEGLGMTFAEEEAHFGMWCIMSSPLLLGCDIAYIPDETMQIITNRELIAVNQDRLGLQARVVQHSGDTYVLAKDLERLHGNTRAVALYNPSDVTQRFEVSAKTLEMTGKMSIRDLNEHRDLGKTSKIDITLPAHAAKILRVKGTRIEPTIYEGEWAFCPEFSDISPSGVKYVPADGASGGVVADKAGGSATNYLRWNDVYSKNGGNYRITFHFMPAKSDFSAEASVNGTKFAISRGNTSIEITLRKGDNEVRIGNAKATLPALDYISVEKN
ncbi:MAG: alpha-galactosidase [Muribaculaceae bacterium]